MAGLKVHRTVSSRPNWTGMSWRIWLRPFESNIGGGGGAIYDLLGCCPACAHKPSPMRWS